MKATKAELISLLETANYQFALLKDDLMESREKVESLTLELDDKTEKLLEATRKTRQDKRKKSILKRENLALSAKLARAEELFMMAMDAWSFRENGLKRNSELRSAELAELDSRKHG